MVFQVQLYEHVEQESMVDVFEGALIIYSFPYLETYRVSMEKDNDFVLNF